jgi:hypothetical protein
VAADVFGVADRRAFLAQHAAVDRARLEIEQGMVLIACVIW